MNERYGLEYNPDDWPYGLRCIDCDKLFEQGDRYSRRLTGMDTLGEDEVFCVEIICLECALTKENTT